MNGAVRFAAWEGPGFFSALTFEVYVSSGSGMHRGASTVTRYSHTDWMGLSVLYASTPVISVFRTHRRVHLDAASQSVGLP